MNCIRRFNFNEFTTFCFSDLTRLNAIRVHAGGYAAALTPAYATTQIVRFVAENIGPGIGTKFQDLDCFCKCDPPPVVDPPIMLIPSLPPKKKEKAPLAGAFSAAVLVALGPVRTSARQISKPLGTGCHSQAKLIESLSVVGNTPP
jgi:hypothetical protein